MILNYAKTLSRSNEESEIWESRVTKINNKLCDTYYARRENKSIIVGSVGRGTAINKTSDYDVIFKLPKDIYLKFDRYKGNGQSSLLYEVKNIIKELYPKTLIRGDRQVVSIEFTDGVIELVPAFEQGDNTFKYPDSKNGGSWKITKPLIEIEESKSKSQETSQVFNYLCYLTRKWKNYVGFSFKGLLIDTLVAKFLDEKKQDDKTELELLENFFKYLSEEDRKKSHWYALGSNQIIHNQDNGKFVAKAKKAMMKFESNTEEIILKELFGYKQDEDRPISEEFIENKFIVDIQYDLRIDCKVSKSGFTETLLSEYLTKKFKLGGRKSLTFFVDDSNIPSELPIKYYWKVRNVGREAIGKERGQIFKGKNKQTEETIFNGNHYVECYVVYNDVVVARDKIKVPIDTTNGK
ncbi:nucleotidyltransferase [Listeria monocytogenes]|nr:nucleotidyltransferase [Listeria monocytogenes]